VSLRSRALPVLLAVAAPALLAGASFADPVAKSATKPAGKTAAAEKQLPTPKEADAAAASFNAFATQWMAKMQRVEDENRRRPERVATGNVTYKGYTDDFRVETRPTGYPGAPFVGLIRYSEQIFSCSDPGATRCGVKQTTPITEIFRFQDGRWIY